MLVTVPNNISITSFNNINADTAIGAREINLPVYFPCEYHQNYYLV
jgi:hypothetical protein